MDLINVTESLGLVNTKEKKFTHRDWLAHVETHWVGLLPGDSERPGPRGWYAAPTVVFDEDAIDEECLLYPNSGRLWLFGRGRRRENVRRIRGLAIELDGGDQKAALRAVAEWPPTSIVFSGSRGLHLVWLFENDNMLDFDAHNEAQIRDAQRGLAELCGGDPQAVEVVRRWRAGGLPRIEAGVPVGMQWIRALLPRTKDRDGIVVWSQQKCPPKRPPLAQPPARASAPAAATQTAEPPPAYVPVPDKLVRSLADPKYAAKGAEDDKPLDVVISLCVQEDIVNVEQIADVLEKHWNPYNTYADGVTYWPFKRKRILRRAQNSWARAKREETIKRREIKAEAEKILEKFLPEDTGEALSVREARERFPNLSDKRIRKLPTVTTKPHATYRVRDLQRLAEPEQLALEAVVERARRIANGDRSEDLQRKTLPGFKEIEFSHELGDSVTQWAAEAVQQAGVTALRAPMGAGKGLAMRALAARLREEGETLLTVTTRIALAEQQAHDWGLTSYRDVEDAKRPQHLAVVLNSIWRVRDSYDYVILDEIEALVRYLDGDLITSCLQEAFDKLKGILQRAKGIYLLDADLRQETIDAIKKLTGKPVYGFEEPVDRHSYALQISTENGLLSWLAQLDVAIYSGKRVAIASNSVKFCDQIRARYPGVNVVVISGRRKPDGDIYEAVRDADVVVWSPSIDAGISFHGEGIDYEFEVWGYFVGARPEQMLQSLRRIRRPSKLVHKVYVGRATSALGWTGTDKSVLGKFLADTRSTVQDPAAALYAEAVARNLIIVPGEHVLDSEGLSDMSQSWYDTKLKEWTAWRDEVAGARLAPENPGDFIVDENTGRVRRWSSAEKLARRARTLGVAVEDVLDDPPVKGKDDDVWGRAAVKIEATKARGRLRAALRFGVARTLEYRETKNKEASGPKAALPATRARKMIELMDAIGVTGDPWDWKAEISQSGGLLVVNGKRINLKEFDWFALRLPVPCAVGVANLTKAALRLHGIYPENPKLSAAAKAKSEEVYQVLSAFALIKAPTKRDEHDT